MSRRTLGGSRLSSKTCDDSPPTAARSRLMGRVRHSGTAPELLLRRALWAAGLHYRLQAKPRLPGSPDIIFPANKVAIFVDGCFWHGCPQHGTHPKTRSEFWLTKIMRNQARDLEADKKLAAMGWVVVRLWEHEVTASPLECVERIRFALEKRGLT